MLASVAGAVVLATVAGARRADTAFERLYETAGEPHIELEFFEPAEAEVVGQMAAVPGVDGAALAALVAVAPDGFGLVPFRDTIAFSLLEEAGEGGFGDRVVEGRTLSGAPDEAHINEAMSELVGLGVGDRMPLVSLSRETGAGFFEGGPLPVDGDRATVEIVGILEGAEDVSDTPDPYVVVAPALYEDRNIFAAPMIAGVRASEEDRPAVMEALTLAFPEASVVPTDRFDERIVDGIHVHVLGLRALAVAVAIAGIVAGVLAGGRLAAAAAADDAVAGAIGLTAGQRRQAAVLRLLPAGLLAAGLAVAGGFALAPVTMAGLAGQAEPDPGWWLDWTAALAVGAGVLFVIAATAAATTGRRRVPAGPRTATVVDRAVAAGIPVVAAIGARRAVGGGTNRWQGRAGIVALAIGVAVVAAVLTFSASVHRLLDDTDAWGAPVDVAVPLGFDNVERLDQLTGEVQDDARIDAAAVVTDAVATVDLPEGDTRTVALMSMDPVGGGVGWTVIEGRDAAGRSEAMVGAALLDQLGLEIGDRFGVTTEGGASHELEVVGEAVIYNTDQVDFAIAVAPETAARIGALGDGPIVVVRYRDGVDVAAAVEDLIDRYGVAEEITRPGSIDNLSELGALPAVLAALVGGLGAVAALLTITAGTGRRRRELATLRAIGATGGQLGATVLWHSATLGIIGVVIGIPLGMAAGRTVYATVAEGLGVLVHPEVPSLALVAVAAGALVGTCLLALPVARLAARARPALESRADYGSGAMPAAL